MYINRLSVLLFLIIAAYFPSFAQKLNSDELAEILGIRSWRIPLPKDSKFEWGVFIVDYAPRDFRSINTAIFNPRQKVLVSLRESGKDTYAYMIAYTVKNRMESTRGELKIDLCIEEAKKVNECENFDQITWYLKAKPYGNGSNFVIADIIKKDIPRKQIVLSLGTILPNGITIY
jgi:hypothetical protein